MGDDGEEFRFSNMPRMVFNPDLDAKAEDTYKVHQVECPEVSANRPEAEWGSPESAGEYGQYFSRDRPTNLQSD